jgi:hypothetical protein
MLGRKPISNNNKKTYLKLFIWNPVFSVSKNNHIDLRPPQIFMFFNIHIVHNEITEIIYILRLEKNIYIFFV